MLAAKTNNCSHFSGSDLCPQTNLFALVRMEAKRGQPHSGFDPAIDSLTFFLIMPIYLPSCLTSDHMHSVMSTVLPSVDSASILALLMTLLL